MKIFIDSTTHTINEYEDNSIGDVLLQVDMRYPLTMQTVINKILTPSQVAKYATGNDIVYTLSKKKQLELEKIIQEYKQL